MRISSVNTMASSCIKLFGKIPPDLRGTYYRVGPGNFKIGNHRYKHPFDGDGKIDKICISPETGVTVESKFVRTAEFEEEEASARVLYRGTFGTKPLVWNPFDRRIKNASNTALVYHAGTLLSMWEAGLPHEIDAETLRTKGLFDMCGVVPRVGFAFSSGYACIDDALGLGGVGVSAHAKTDPVTGQQVVFTAQAAPRHVNIRVLAFPSGSFSEPEARAFDIAGFTHCHDFALTPNYYIFFASAFRMDYVSFARGLGPAECVTHIEGDTMVYLVPRDASKHVRTTTIAKCFVTHFINAFEAAGDDCLVVDAMCSEHISLTSVPLIKPVRYVFSLHHDRFELGAFVEHSCCLNEFPAINPRFEGQPYRYFYSASSTGTSKLMDSWACHDTWTGRVTRTQPLCKTGLAEHAVAFFLEPTFVPRSVQAVERCGYLVGVLITDDGNALLIVDAATMEMVCAYDISSANVIGLHGLFIPTC